MILNTLLRQHMGRGVSTTPRLNRMFVAFLFAHINSAKFTRIIKREFPEATNDQVKEFRKSLNSNGYILFNLKPYIFRAFKRDCRKKIECKQIGNDFGVDPSDLKLVLCCWANQSMEQHMTLLADQYPALAPKTLHKKIRRIASENRLFAHKFVLRKMRFIWKNPHNSTTANDLTTDQLITGIQSVMVKFPRIETMDHASNIARRGIHNGGINTIKTFTRKSRAVITGDGEGGFVGKVGFFDDSTETAAMSDHKPNDVQVLEGRINVQQLLSFYKGPKKVAVKALMGLHLNEFSAWLEDNAASRHRIPNDELFDAFMERNALDQYERYLVQYLGIDQQRIVSLKHDIKRYL